MTCSISLHPSAWDSQFGGENAHKISNHQGCQLGVQHPTISSCTSDPNNGANLAASFLFLPEYNVLQAMNKMHAPLHVQR
jgi:hypothetical protein